jgi:hypothetical protein
MHPVQQGAQILGGALLGGRFQGLPGCQHHPDERTGQILPDRERTGQ